MQKQLYRYLIISGVIRIVVYVTQEYIEVRQYIRLYLLLKHISWLPNAHLRLDDWNAREFNNGIVPHIKGSSILLK